MVSVHSSKTEVGTRDWGIAVIGLTMLLFERMWIWGLWIWKAVECFKWGLIGYTSRNMGEYLLLRVILIAWTWPKRFQ